MARIAGTTPLDTGDRFPPTTLALVDGSELRLPSESGRWTIFLGYRGEW